MTANGRARYQSLRTWSEKANNGGARSNGVDSRGSLVEAHGFDSAKVTRFYPRGSVLFREGQLPRGVHVLCEGRVKVSIGSPEGKTLVLGIAQRGELLGVNATLTGQPYEATVETLGRCRIDFISRQDVLKLIEHDHNAVLRVARSLSQKLSGVVEHTRMVLLSQSAAERLARLLIKWCDEAGKRTRQETRIETGLTHEEIGQMTCVSRETVTRLLNELKRKQIITVTDNAIFVRNRKALELVARSENNHSSVIDVTVRRRR